MKSLFNIIAIGQCGNRLGQIFEKKGFRVAYFNFDEVDFFDINGQTFNQNLMKGNKLLLDGKGTGRSVKKGREYINKYSQIIEDFIETNTSYDKITLLLGGLGGGTFSSSVSFFLKTIIKQNKKVGVIATLPKKQTSGGLTTRENTYIILRELKNYPFSFFMLVDNEKISKQMDEKTLIKGWSEINEKIVEKFMSIKKIVQNHSTGQGVGSIDMNEVLRVLVNGGFTSIINKRIHFSDLEKITVNEFLKGQELVKGFDYKNSESFALSFIISHAVLPKSVELFVENILKKFNKLSESGFYGIFYRDDYEPYMDINILANGLGLPNVINNRVKNLNRDIERAKEKEVKKKEKEDNIFSDFDLKVKKSKGSFDF